MFKFFKKLFEDLYFFAAAYSNNIFPEPLTKEEEEKYGMVIFHIGKIKQKLLDK